MRKLLTLLMVLSAAACGFKDGHRSRGKEFAAIEAAKENEQRARENQVIAEEEVKAVKTEYRPEVVHNTFVEEDEYRPEPTGKPRHVEAVRSYSRTEERKAAAAETTVLDVPYNENLNRPTQKQIYVNVEKNAEFNEMVTPDVYGVLAARATNKMLDETAYLYEKIPAPTLYVLETQKADEDLPNGFYVARKTAREIVDGSRTFILVNNLNDADYFLEIFVDKIKDHNSNAWVLEYKSSLFNKKNEKIKEWSETLTRVRNDDQSWW